jgi:hypothetical protein
MRGFWTGSMVLVLMALGQPQTLSAEPILLGALQTSTSASGEPSLGGPSLHQHFILTYQTSGMIPLVSDDTYAGIPFQDGSRFTFPLTYCLGCDTEVPLNWTGTTEFAADRYSQFISNLSNGINDGALWQLTIFTRDDNTTVKAVGTWDEENEIAPGVSQVDLALWEIEFIRLNVAQNTTTWDSTTNVFSVSFSANWEFWGQREGESDPAPVPEPASGILVASAGALAAAKRKRWRARRGGEDGR